MFISKTNVLTYILQDPLDPPDKLDQPVTLEIPDHVDPMVPVDHVVQTDQLDQVVNKDRGDQLDPLESVDLQVRYWFCILQCNYNGSMFNMLKIPKYPQCK